MQAIILAAGMGKRLKHLTENNTKCMVRVNGETLIERMLHQLDELALKKIVLVVGYEREKLINYISSLNIKTPIEYIENPIYNKTNNIYSLFLAKEVLRQDDCLLLESDVIFEKGTLQLLVDDTYPTLALVDKFESWMDGTVVTLSEDNSIIDFIPKKRFRFEDTDRYYKTVNVYKFSKQFSNDYYIPFLAAYVKAMGENEYYEQVLRVITMLDNSEIKAKPIQGKQWYEIDDAQDLDIAESMFAEGNRKLQKIACRYGGYWRYPLMLDFCYLVNPYFPPQRLCDEIKNNFDILLTQYPSGMHVNSLLASKVFGVCEEHILVGNGAAELIQTLMPHFSGNVGFVRPTFEEYPNRYAMDKSIVFHPNCDDFSYNSQELRSFFADKSLEALVLINPDNPTGNYIAHDDMMSLVKWTKEKHITLVIDESFADFSDEEENTFIDDAFIRDNPHVIVVKSISKSYGVPGLRLGILASGNTNLIANLKKEVSIWNINSFAEFYLQIMEKYKNEYSNAMHHFRKTRKEFLRQLQNIPFIRTLPTQANFIMAELNGISSEELAMKLLEKHILIKDLSPKIANYPKQYVRIAIRSEAENQRLISALESIS